MSNHVAIFGEIKPNCWLFSSALTSLCNLSLGLNYQLRCYVRRQTWPLYYYYYFFLKRCTSGVICIAELSADNTRSTLSERYSLFSRRHGWRLSYTGSMWRYHGVTMLNGNRYCLSNPFYFESTVWTSHRIIDQIKRKIERRHAIFVVLVVVVIQNESRYCGQIRLHNRQNKKLVIDFIALSTTKGHLVTNKQRHMSVRI